jgi:hypothetical protein
MKRIIFGVVAALGVLTAIAVAQVPGLFIASPTGLEQINVLVPSTGTLVTNPQIQTVTINQIRNTQGYTLVAAGTTVNTTIPNTSSILLATGAITTWNVTFPTAPYDGLLVKIGCPGGNVGTLTPAATLPTGVTIVGASFGSCTEATPTDAAWIYNTSGNIWYRTE